MCKLGKHWVTTFFYLKLDVIFLVAHNNKNHNNEKIRREGGIMDNTVTKRNGTKEGLMTMHGLPEPPNCKVLILICIGTVITQLQVQL